MKVSLSDHLTYKKVFFATFPSILMMVFSSVYSVIDGLFVSNFVGTDAFSGINLVFPMIAILWGIGFMFGSGGSALVGKTLGEGDKEKANSIFSFVIYALVTFSVIFAIIGYFLVEPFTRWMASLSSDKSESMVDTAIVYGHILALALPFAMLQNVFQSFFVTNERPITGFLFILAGGISNIVLDALFIAGLKWGVIGAAVATVIGQVIAGIGPIFYFIFKKDSLLNLGKTRFDIKVLGKTMSNGSSEFVSNIASSIVSLCYNAQLLVYVGTNGVSSYGIIMYLSYVFMAIFMGYSVGMAPIVSYNYGAQNKEELHNIFVKSMIVIGVAGLAMFGISEGVGPAIVSLFADGNNELYEIGSNAFHIYSFVFLTAGFSIFGSGFFTALNNGLVSAIISIVRALIFELIAVWTLPLWLGVNGIWAAGPFAEIASTAMTIFFYIKEKKKYGY